MNNPKIRILVPIFLFVSAIGLNIPILQNEFVHFDDGHGWYANQNLIKPWNTWEDIKWIFSLEQTVRLVPVSWVIYKSIVNIWGMDPIGIRIISLILHSLNTLLIYFISKRLINWGSKDYIGAFIITLIWLTHPLRVEPIAWATALTYPISTFWSLLAIFLILENKKEKARVDILALICAITATLSYPIALMVPMTIPLWIYLRKLIYYIPVTKPNKFEWILFSLSLLPTLIISGVTFYYANFVSSNWGSGDGIKLNIPQTLYNISNSFLYFLYVSIFPPREISPGHYPGEPTIFIEVFVIGILILGYIIYKCMRFSRNRSQTIVLSLIYCTLILPALKIFGEPNLQTDRYSYLSSWLILCMLIRFVNPIEYKKILFLGLPLILIYIQVSLYQHTAWKDTPTLVAKIREGEYEQKSGLVNVLLEVSLAEYEISKRKYKKALSRLENIGKINSSEAKPTSKEWKKHFTYEVIKRANSNEKEALLFLQSLEEQELSDLGNGIGIDIKINANHYK